MNDPYWKYAAADGRQQQQQPPLHSLAGKRPRPDYDVPGGRDFPGHLAVKDSDAIGASYDFYLHGATQFPPFRGDNEASRLMGAGPGVRDAGLLGGRPGFSLPPDASSTLFVEGLPSDCARREVAHIFRPFVGYKEVRLINKGSRHSSGDPFVLCFVDFESPAEAATAKEALKGYKFDEHDRDSVSLRMQFARNPGVRVGGEPKTGRRGRR